METLSTEITTSDSNRFYGFYRFYRFYGFSRFYGFRFYRFTVHTFARGGV
jgi:hypothetical protein